MSEITEIYYNIKEENDKVKITILTSGGLCFSNEHWGGNIFNSRKEAELHIKEILKPAYKEILNCEYKIIEVSEDDERYVENLEFNNWLSDETQKWGESFSYRFWKWRQEKKEAIRKWLLKYYLKFYGCSEEEMRLKVKLGR